MARGNGIPLSEKKTAALLWGGKVEDEGTNSIRIDSSLRRNLGASIDDVVLIRRIEAEIAEKVTFAGLEESVIVKNSQH